MTPVDVIGKSGTKTCSPVPLSVSAVPVLQRAGAVHGEQRGGVRHTEPPAPGQAGTGAPLPSPPPPSVVS